MQKSSTPFGETAGKKRKPLADGGNAHKVRKKKRYAWSDDLHKRFMASIFDIGLNHAKPKGLLALIQPAPEGLTTEHIKSHLQKYRKNSKATRSIFLEQYEFSKNLYVDEYKGKALNPGHHAYPLSMSCKASLKLGEILCDDDNFPLKHEDLTKAIVIGNQELLESTKNMGPGRLVFIPTASSSPPARDRSIQMNDPMNIPKYEKRLQEQLSTQQIIQAQRNKYNMFTPQHQVMLKPPSNEKAQYGTKPSAFDGFEGVGSSFLSTINQGLHSGREWHSLADVSENEKSKLDDLDEVFKFLED